MYVSTIGIIARQWATSSLSPSQTNPALSVACAWLDAQWLVVMTMDGRSKSQDSPATDALMRAVACTALRGVQQSRLGMHDSSLTSWTTSRGHLSRQAAGDVLVNGGGAAGLVKVGRE